MSHLTSASQQYIHVSVLNYPHLSCLLGTVKTVELINQLSVRLSNWGGVRFLSAGDLLIEVKKSLVSESDLSERIVVECSRNVYCLAGEKCILILSVQPAQLKADEDQLLALEAEHSWISQVAPVQYNDIWRGAYKNDMQLGVCFLKQLRDEQLSLALQPIKHTCDPTLELYKEALLRNFECIGDGFSTVTVISALENLGLVRLLDYHVLKCVIKELKHSVADRIGCNISAQSATRDCWWGTILEDLSKNPTLAGRLTIEITETNTIPCTNEAINFLLSLKQLGVKVAIDDFGSGSSSWSLVCAVPVDVIKIDKGYLSAARNSRKSARLLIDFVNTCKYWAAKVVIEGVESQSDLLYLASIQERLWVQGYFIARPSLAYKIGRVDG
ncbi:EAL domain-containing protein [Pseudomonas sp. PGPR81]|uniref:EAL domain-containing protein n=1 Tax=Pseudomonas sp. PGPR81 TaxID=2913477 RepID=UPI001EDB3517|nr:EAL domain-containing protein [Pseudomonas sp. PGPR81]